MLFQRSQTIFVVTLAMMEPLILVRSSTMEPSPVSQQDPSRERLPRGGREQTVDDGMPHRLYTFPL